MSHTSLFTSQETNKPDIAACKYSFPENHSSCMLLDSIPTNISLRKEAHPFKTIEVIFNTQKTRFYRISTPSGDQLALDFHINHYSDKEALLRQLKLQLFLHETLKNPLLLDLKEIYESEGIVSFVYTQDGTSFDPSALQTDQERLDLILRILLFFVQLRDLNLSVTEFSTQNFVDTGKGKIKMFNFGRLSQIGSVQTDNPTTPFTAPEIQGRGSVLDNTDSWILG